MVTSYLKLCYFQFVYKNDDLPSQIMILYGITCRLSAIANSFYQFAKFNFKIKF